MPADPRPLLGEPVALDLLNTEWVQGGRPVDFFATPDGVAIWLATNGIDSPAGEPVREHLMAARSAIRSLLERGDDADRRRLNDVLAHARVRVSVGDDGPERTVEVDDPAWLPAALAAFDLVDLLTGRRDRIRRCAHPACVLWFLDTSRNGTRRWCSMATCGNRLKAQRHYDRARQQGAPGS
ncbi:MAG TPA: CGNR zinc finger domain-containing protein [Acidimicrobiales bacterium]|nr:CGNR zinc finger domain-containing protein [Acidimicrobiales bacterium]